MATTQISLETEYKKTGIAPSDIQVLRDWLKTQPHLPGEQITDLDLILIYHCCNRSTAVSKQILDLNYTLRTHIKFIFANRVYDSRIERAISTTLVKLLPTRSKAGYAAVYTRTLNTDGKSFIFEDLARASFMALDLWQYEEGTWPGFIFLIDMAKTPFSHVAAVKIQELQQFLYYLQEAMLVNLKCIHFINAASFMDKMMTLVRPFLKKEILDAMKVHQTGSNTLEEFYPIDALPKEAGGSYISVQECRDEVLSKLKANQRFFDEEGSKRVDESKRPGKPKSVTDFFGSVEGSFKKLDID